MKKSPLLAVGIVSIFLLSGCGTTSTSSTGNSSDSSPASGAPLKFTLNEQGNVPYACQEVYQQGVLCTLDVNVQNTGNKVFNYDFSAVGVDDQGRTFAPQLDSSDSNYSLGGKAFINPGETLDWSLEFPVSSGTHLTSVQFFQSGTKIATVGIDLRL